MRACSFHLVARVLVAIVFASAAAAHGADADRDGRWELFAIAKHFGGDDTTTSSFFPGEGVELDDSVSFGLGAGYSFSDHVNLNATFVFGDTDWQFGFDGVSTGTESSPMIQMLGNADWNLLDSRLTPFLTAGAGVVMFPDSSLVGAGEFNYGVGAGVRWDFAEHGFLKVWYRAEWFGLANADDGLQLHTFNVGIGIMR